MRLDRPPVGFVRTTLRDRDAAPAPDLVHRNFQASRRDLHVPATLRTELILDAIEMAISRRRPGDGLIHHLRSGHPVHEHRVQAARPKSGHHTLHRTHTHADLAASAAQ